MLAIPHNGNLSNGRMFEIVDFAGNPLTRQYAETRSNWEPLVEVTQMKGDGETHPYFHPTTSLRTSSVGTGEILTLARTRSRRCSSTSTPARP